MLKLHATTRSPFEQPMDQSRHNRQVNLAMTAKGILIITKWVTENGMITLPWRFPAPNGRNLKVWQEVFKFSFLQLLLPYPRKNLIMWHEL
jgi:Zn-dependent peptidase ImmA (M78 family)